MQSVHLLSEKIINKQQEVADKCCSLGLIPKKVNVRDGFLSQEQYTEITPKEVLASNSYEKKSGNIPLISAIFLEEVAGRLTIFA